MPQSWLIVERLENWEVDQRNRFSFYGLPKHLGKTASKIDKDDSITPSFAPLVGVKRTSISDCRPRHAALLGTARAWCGILPFTHLATGGAYDSHHQTAGIAGCTRRRSRVAARVRAHQPAIAVIGNSCEPSLRSDTMGSPRPSEPQCE